MLGAPTDGELRAEWLTATSDRRTEIIDELDRRADLRSSIRGHDPRYAYGPSVRPAG